MPYASDVAFTESVKRVQRERGSRKSYERLEQQRGGFASAITPEIAAYIAERGSAYLATANTSGQPYVQHRGGPPGFIKVLDPQTLAFADFAGNRQYITSGNLAENDRAFLFLMNYAAGERVKIWGRAHIVTEDQQLFADLVDPHYDARVEQAIVFTVTAWDANCSQHIPNFIRAEATERALDVLRRRIRYLEAALRDAHVTFVPQDDFSKD
jgi:uncharacterized protein